MSYLGSLWAGHSAPVWRIGHLLILRLTPLGLHLPRLETTRSSSISSRTTSFSISIFVGGKGGECRRFPPHDAYGMDK